MTQATIEKENKEIAKQYKELLRISYQTLSDDDKAIIRSGDIEKIRNHLGDDSPPGCMIF